MFTQEELQREINKIALKAFKAGIKNEQQRQLHKKNKKRKLFTKKTRRWVLLLQANQCRNCKRYLNVYEFDHIDGEKSNNYIGNCQALCPNCHAEKTRKRIV